MTGKLRNSRGGPRWKPGSERTKCDDESWRN